MTGDPGGGARPGGQGRLAAGAGLFAASVAGWVALVASDPAVYWRQSDALVYRAAAVAVAHGDALYGAVFGPARLPFTYPPFAALLFAPFAPLSFPVWQVLLAVVGLCCLPLSARAALRLAGHASGGAPAAWGAAFAIAAVGLWLEPVDLTLHFGQINLVLMTLVLVDLALPDGTRGKGVLIGVAAGVKLTPLIFVPYLLLTRRMRAAAWSLGAFAATVAVGFAVLGPDSLRYWSGRFDQPGDDPDRLVNQSLEGVLLRALRDDPRTDLLWWKVAAAVVVLGLGTAVLAARRGRQLLGACLCAASGLLVSPISWTHHWVYVVPALALIAERAAPRPGAEGRSRVAGVLGSAMLCAVVAVFAWWPLPVGPHGGIDAGLGPHPSGLLRLVPHDDGAELRWSGWQRVWGDGYVILALAFVLGCAAWLAVTARRDEGASAVARPPCETPKRRRRLGSGGRLRPDQPDGAAARRAAQPRQ